MENGRDGFMQYLKEEAERVRKERVASRLPRAKLAHVGRSASGRVNNPGYLRNGTEPPEAKRSIGNCV